MVLDRETNSGMVRDMHIQMYQLPAFTDRSPPIKRTADASITRILATTCLESGSVAHNKVGVLHCYRGSGVLNDMGSGFTDHEGRRVGETLPLGESRRCLWLLLG